VQHVTYLSAYGMEAAPPEVGPRAIELDLLSRNHFTHSIIRSAWFMQNFSEGHLVPRDGFIVVPTGQGTEAFVDVEASIATGLPADYSGMLAMPTETIATGHGSQPNNDLEKATGTPATTLTDVARRTASQRTGAQQ
jgi:hypothetical protein